MMWELPAFNGETIMILGSAQGIRIAIFGRDNAAHDMILLTPAEAIKVRNALGKAIDRAVTDIEGFACKGLADFNEGASE